MEFRNRVKNRRLKRYINHIINIFKLRSLNFKLSQKIILFGIIINFISLFFNWIISTGEIGNHNSFSTLSGYIGFIIVFFLILLIINLFSINSKEKMQLHISVHFKDYPVTIILGGIIIILSIVSINFINAMDFFSITVTSGNAIIVSITSSIIILLGGIIQRREFIKCSTRIKMYEVDNNEIYNEEILKPNTIKDNMKLPF